MKGPLILIYCVILIFLNSNQFSLRCNLPWPPNKILFSHLEQITSILETVFEEKGIKKDIFNSSHSLTNKSNFPSNFASLKHSSINDKLIVSTDKQNAEDNSNFVFNSNRLLRFGLQQNLDKEVKLQISFNYLIIN